MNKVETDEVYKEIVKILKENYVNTSKFRDELISVLKQRTGNNRLGTIFENVIIGLNSRNNIVT